MRKARVNNVVKAWSVQDKEVDDERSFMDFPELPENEVRLRGRVEWWNRKMEEVGLTGCELAACAETEFRFHEKGWF